MTKPILAAMLLLFSVCSKSQWYYGATSGVSIGTTTTYNPYTHVNETYNYGGFFFSAPVGYSLNNNFLFEFNGAYNGLLYSTLCAGLQGNLSERCSVNFLTGVADNLMFYKKPFQLTHRFTPSGTFRLCGEHFYFSVAYQDKMIWAGLGVKAFAYE